MSKESQKYSTVSEAISQPFPSTQLPEMLNKLGITSGARMARIFIYLLRKSDSADFPNPWVSLPSWHLMLHQAYQTSRIVDGSFGPWWAKIGWKCLHKIVLYFRDFFSVLANAKIALDLKYCTKIRSGWERVFSKKLSAMVRIGWERLLTKDFQVEWLG